MPKSARLFTLLLSVLVSIPSLLFSQADSVSLPPSPQLGHPNNLLLERLQYKEGTLYRNDFVRDYSPFDARTIRLNSEPSMAEEIIYRSTSPGRQLTYTLRDQTSTVTFVPLLEGQLFDIGSGRALWKRSEGVAVTGSIGDNVVFYGKAVDNIVRGGHPDMVDGLSNQPAFVIARDYGDLGFDYDDTEMQLGFRFGIAQLYIEKIRNTWGYGRGGAIVLSDKAPSHPQLRLTVQVLDNLKYTMIVGDLYSGLLDSTSSYIDYTDGSYSHYRRVVRQKYLMAHVFEFSPIKQLNLAFGEEMIVSDRFAPEYLLPLVFYHTLGVQSDFLDNYNLWGGARYTFPSYGSVYTTLYVDDFDAAQKKTYVAGTIGGTLVDFDHRNIDLTAEYTFLRPFVYINDVTASDRTSDGYPLGSWLGQNADMIAAWVDYRPLPQLWFTASFQNIRKGVTPTIAQKYANGGGGNPEAVPFLGGPLFSRHELDLRCRWEVYPGLLADASYRLVTQNDEVANRYPTFANHSLASLALKLNIFDWNDEW
jgi:hypothetical protein